MCLFRQGARSSHLCLLSQDQPFAPMKSDSALARGRPPVAFLEGPWAQRDRAHVMQALEVVERRVDLPEVPSELCPPWVCQHYLTRSGGPVYAASRYRLARVLTARSALELRLKLLDMAGAIGTY